MTLTTELLDRAVQLTELIERVHGANHPELSRVRELTGDVAATDDRQRRRELFGELREVSANYTVPADGCEGYQAAYATLREAEAAHAA